MTEEEWRSRYGRMLDQIHDALLGTYDGKPGLISRVDDLETAVQALKDAAKAKGQWLATHGVSIAATVISLIGVAMTIAPHLHR